jgi:hypothetical protein
LKLEGEALKSMQKQLEEEARNEARNKSGFYKLLS